MSKLPNAKSGLTMRAADGGYAPRFLAFFVALSFFRFDGESCPTHLPLTRAVSLPLLKILSPRDIIEP
jgi:hypothetical protein